MKAWTEKKNEHKAIVQKRWDSRGKMNKMFDEWKLATGWKSKDKEGRMAKEGKAEGKEKTYYGIIKHWGRTTNNTGDT
eukprot:4846040-Pleurochrysis_carterae.AAC.1